MLQKRKEKTYMRYVIYIVLIMMLCICSISGTVRAEGILELQGKVTEDKRILLEWEAQGADTVFEICKSQDDGNTYETMAILSGQTGVIKCYDENITMGLSYCYKVIERINADSSVASGDAVPNGGLVWESNVVKVKAALPIPEKFKAKVIKKSRVKLIWAKVKNAHSYTLYRSTQKDKGFKKLKTTKNTRYTDYDVKRGKVYYYQIVANHKKNKTWQSQKSPVISAHLKPVAPMVVGSYAKKKIKLTWAKISGADYYYVYKKSENGKFELVSETKKLYYKDSDVERGKSYTYKVVAIGRIDGMIVRGDESKPYIMKALELDPNKKMIALTYDDGPSIYTKDIVQCLQDNQSKATFFVLGCNIDKHKQAVLAADKLGCEIGNHTYNHPMLNTLPKERIKKEIDSTDAKLEKLLGYKATLMRPPGGAVNATVEKTVGKPIIMWSIDTRDWEHRNSTKVISSVMNNVKDGDIILMHDIYESTRDASRVLIPRLRREGYQLVTVSELAQCRGYELEKGAKYKSLRKIKK